MAGTTIEVVEWKTAIKICSDRSDLDIESLTQRIKEDTARRNVTMIIYEYPLQRIPKIRACSSTAERPAESGEQV